MFPPDCSHFVLWILPTMYEPEFSPPSFKNVLWSMSWIFGNTEYYESSKYKSFLWWPLMFEPWLVRRETCREIREIKTAVVIEIKSEMEREREYLF